jgi:hypothetical protein
MQITADMSRMWTRKVPHCYLQRNLGTQSTVASYQRETFPYRPIVKELPQCQVLVLLKNVTRNPIVDPTNISSYQTFDVEESG